MLTTDDYLPILSHRHYILCLEGVIPCVRPAGVLLVKSAGRLLKTASVQDAKKRRLTAVAKSSAKKSSRSGGFLSMPDMVLQSIVWDLPYGNMAVWVLKEGWSYEAHNQHRETCTYRCRRRCP